MLDGRMAERSMVDEVTSLQNKPCHSDELIHLVNPFIGTEAADVPERSGLASRWFWPKPQIGNTHPGACLPYGMVSAMPYTGGYPTGYGCYGKSLQGRPVKISDSCQISGFTHFQQSGVGAIRKYYNYCRVTPLLVETGGLATLGNAWTISNEQASPGKYSCAIDEQRISAEITVTSRGSIHRYTFPKSEQAVIAVDFSHGGIVVDDGRTIPLRAEMYLSGHTAAEACVTMEGLPIRMAVSISGLGNKSHASLWENGELCEGHFKTYESIRESTFYPFGVLFTAPTEEGQVVEIELAFSFRSREQARKNLATGTSDFQIAQASAEASWKDKLGRIQISGGDHNNRCIFATALYHSLIKPSEAHDESPFWPWKGPFFFDFSTLWDMYKTQLPLMLSLFPDDGSNVVNSLLTVYEMEGNFPIGYRLARGYDRFSHQASGLAHVVFADAYHRCLSDIDWEHVVTLMVSDFSRAYGEAFLQDGLVHPITHTLDLAYAAFCTATIAHGIGDRKTARHMESLATHWQNAFSEDGLLKDSTFYEGTRWNYSFRLLHDMAGRINALGGDAEFIRLLDKFFGYGAQPCEQPKECPSHEEMVAGAALGRFEGLNNEPDMEAPYAYIYAGRHDRTCEVVRACLTQCFQNARGGLVGNDDSGGMSSWYVWSALGIFPVAGQDVFLIGSPLFENAQIQINDSTTLSIEAINNQHHHPYVANCTFNGKSLDRPFLYWSEIASGGTLCFQMSSIAQTWTDVRPPSHGTQGL